MVETPLHVGRTEHEARDVPGRRRRGARTAMNCDARVRSFAAATNAGPGPVRSPLRCACRPAFHRRCDPACARGVSWVGLASRWRYRPLRLRAWSGIRTRDKQNQLLSLYPTELSSGGRSGLEPDPPYMPALSPGELPPVSPWPQPRVLPAYATATPRAPAGMTIRTVGNIGQYDPDYPRANADNVVRPILLIGRVNVNYRSALPALEHHHAAHMRRSAAVPLPQGVRQHAPDAPGQNLSVPDRKRDFSARACAHARPLRMPKKEKPPGFQGPEGIRVASGDRGGRPPRGASTARRRPPCRWHCRHRACTAAARAAAARGVLRDGLDSDSWG